MNISSVKFPLFVGKANSHLSIVPLLGLGLTTVLRESITCLGEKRAAHVTRFCCGGVARGRGGSCSVKQYRITATWHSKLPGGTRVYRG